MTQKQNTKPAAWWAVPVAILGSYVILFMATIIIKTFWNVIAFAWGLW